jgi:hypothetical protein
MKKFYPYILPTIALIIVGFLAYRWYDLRTQRDGEITPFAEGVEIENLSETEADRVIRGVGDFETAPLSGSGEAQGNIRYEIKDDKVSFSVTADLPELESGQYQVWLQDIDGKSRSKAFSLVMGKGGYMGSGALSADTVPFDVVVSQENTDDSEIEEVVLQGTVKQD